MICQALFLGCEPLRSSVNKNILGSYKKKLKRCSAFSLSLAACIHLQVSSSITGPIIVEDVIYEADNGDISRILPSKDLTFRRLVFQRSEGLVQSEALLSEEGSKYKILGETERKKTKSSSKSKRRGIQRRSDGIFVSLLL